MTGYIVGLIGMWLLGDSVWSICYYLDRKEETWLRNHSVRLVRMVCALCLIIIGGILI